MGRLSGRKGAFNDVFIHKVRDDGKNVQKNIFRYFSDRSAAIERELDSIQTRDQNKKKTFLFWHRKGFLFKI